MNHYSKPNSRFLKEGDYPLFERQNPFINPQNYDRPRWRSTDNESSLNLGEISNDAASHDSDRDRPNTTLSSTNNSQVHRYYTGHYNNVHSNSEWRPTENSSNAERIHGWPTSQAFQFANTTRPTHDAPIDIKQTEEKLRTNRKFSWYTVFVEWGQETAFEGFKYFTDPHSHLFRRIVWLLFFLGAFAFLLFLFADKLHKLLSNPSSINLDVDYATSLPFPTVTICNENPFRLTAIQRNDLYDFLIIDGGVPGNGSNIPEAKEGHFMIMLYSSSRPHYTARLLTNYMNTTNMCIELFYQLGTDGDDRLTSLSVNTISEELEVIQATSTNNVMTEWTRLFAILPPGTNRVSIEGRIGNAGCNISIDDVIIQLCSYFDAESQCKIDPLGRGYLGQLNTSNGLPCLPWDTVINMHLLGSNTLVPDKNGADAMNYCRYIPGLDWPGPSCIVTIEGQFQNQSCDIPFCACRQPTALRCASRFCLPVNEICDGTDYCNDGSTSNLHCKTKNSVQCTFDDPYMCGYQHPSVGNAQWSWTSVSLSDIGNATVDSSLGNQGDQVQLISPTYTYQTPTSMTFSYYLQNGGIGGALSLYQYSVLRVPVLLLFADSDHVNSLQTVTVCLPNGTYQLLFLATLGQPYASDVSINNVILGGSCTFTPSPQVSLTSCGFYGYICGYVTLQIITSSASQWQNMSTAESFATCDIKTTVCAFVLMKSSTYMDISWTFPNESSDSNSWCYGKTNAPSGTAAPQDGTNTTTSMTTATLR